MRLRVATWISLLGLAMTAQAQTTQRQYQLQKTGDAPPVLKLVEAPVRQPDEHEVLVRVHAVSLNRRDIYVKLGRYPGPMRTNLVPLSDGAGEVVATGTKVTRFKKGDRVASIFFQQWLEGRFKPEHFATRAGRRHRRHVVAVRDAQRKRPRRDPEAPELRGSGHAALRRRHRLECARDPRSHAAGRFRVAAGHGWRFDSRTAARAGAGRESPSSPAPPTKNWRARSS